jgi:hypothetical protein
MSLFVVLYTAAATSSAAVNAMSESNVSRKLKSLRKSWFVSMIQVHA